MNLNDVIGYFDLQSHRRTLLPEQQAANGQSFPVWPQYAALVLGIAVQPFFAKFQQTHMWNLDGWQGWVVFSLIAGILIFPGIYKKTFDASGNLWVQLCAIFASGIGWQSLLETGAKATNVVK